MWDMAEHGWGWIGVGMVHMLLFWALIILAIVAIVRYLSSTSRREISSDRDPLDILRVRYAKGEIDKQEFDEKRRDLEA